MYPQNITVSEAEVACNVEPLQAHDLHDYYLMKVNAPPPPPWDNNTHTTASTAYNTYWKLNETSKPAAQRNRFIIQIHRHCATMEMLLPFLTRW